MLAYQGFSFERKIEVIQAYENGQPIHQLCSKFGISKRTLRDWLRQWSLGVASLEPKAGWKSYPKELKIAAISDYMNGNLSQNEVLIKYRISSRSVFRKWLKKYNGHGEVPKGLKERRDPRTKGRKMTWQERIEIAQQCIASGKDYQGTAETYKVSNNQVYQWVKKYEEGQEEALKDGRGRKKADEELTSEQRLKLEIKRIEKENERLRAQNALLKKLDEIERRRF